MKEKDITNHVNEEAYKLLVQLGIQAGEIDIQDIMELLPGIMEDPQLLDDVIQLLTELEVNITGGRNPQRVFSNNGAGTGNANASDKGLDISRGDLDGVQADDLISIYFHDATHVPLLTREQEIELTKKIERGRWARRQLAKNGNYSEKSEPLGKLIQDGTQARRHLVRANVRLVISVAKKFTGRGVPFIDLIQEGNIGLMRSLKKYDHSLGYKFSTYATWWIRQAISRAVANQGRTIRIPAYMSDQIVKMNWTVDALTKELKREPSLDEVSAALGLSPKRVQFMRRVARQTLSMDKPKFDDDDSELGDFLPDGDAPEPEESAAQSVLRDSIEQIFERLPPREARVLRMRYGLNGRKPHTLKEVGDKLGVSRERVRQLEARAKRRFRRYAPPDLL